MPESSRTELHLLAFAPARVWAGLLREYGGVSRRYWWRFAGAMAGFALTVPLRVAEQVCHHRRIANTRIEHPPVFILGPARSGTTFLHNLMAHDPAFGYMSTLHALIAPLHLVAHKWLRPVIASKLPARRPTDNVALSVDLPQEEELAFALNSHMSAFSAVVFPDHARRAWERYGLMNLTEPELREWKRRYLEVLQKVTIARGGRRLVLKTPPNLGRTAVLRAMFPDARFVFIMRNPYTVYMSQVKLFRKLIPLYQLRTFDWDDFEAAMLDNYVATMNSYMDDRDAIPEGQLAEVRYEDLEVDPAGVLEQVYAKLGLPWAEASEPVNRYASSLAGYQKNRYEIEPSVIDRVNHHWGAIIREWGYDPP